MCVNKKCLAVFRTADYNINNDVINSATQRNATSFMANFLAWLPQFTQDGAVSVLLLCAMHTMPPSNSLLSAPLNERCLQEMLNNFIVAGSALTRASELYPRALRDMCICRDV